MNRVLYTTSLKIHSYINELNFFSRDYYNPTIVKYYFYSKILRRKKKSISLYILCTRILSITIMLFFFTI